MLLSLGDFQPSQLQISTLLLLLFPRTSVKCNLDSQFSTSRAVINTLTKLTQHREERVCLAYVSLSNSIVEGSQDRTLRQEPGGRSLEAGAEAEVRE